MTENLESTNSSVGVLALAQKLHDEYVADGKAEHDRLVTEATNKHEELLNDGKSKHDELIKEATELSELLKKEGEDQKSSLVAEAELRASEIIEEAGKAAEELRTRSIKESEDLLESAREQADLTAKESEREESAIRERIAQLQQFESSYTARLREIAQKSVEFLSIEESFGIEDDEPLLEPTEAELDTSNETVVYPNPGIFKPKEIHDEEKLDDDETDDDIQKALEIAMSEDPETIIVGEVRDEEIK